MAQFIVGSGAGNGSPFDDPVHLPLGVGHFCSASSPSTLKGGSGVSGFALRLPERSLPALANGGVEIGGSACHRGPGRLFGRARWVDTAVVSCDDHGIAEVSPIGEVRLRGLSPFHGQAMKCRLFQRVF